MTNDAATTTLRANPAGFGVLVVAGLILGLFIALLIL